MTWNQLALSKSVTIVFSIITFELEVNGIPEKYCTEIETVMLDFLWSSNKHRVSRNTLKIPKSHGGLICTVYAT